MGNDSCPGRTREAAYIFYQDKLNFPTPYPSILTSTSITGSDVFTLVTIFRRDNFDNYENQSLPTRLSLDHTIYINLIFGHKMSKAFQALRCIHSIHVQVVDGKDSGISERSQDADVGQAID